MADIAILVAEEYERRVKMNSRNNEQQPPMKTEFVSCVSDLAHTLHGKIAQQNLEVFVNWVKEPTTQIALHASNGFFSA